MRRSRREDGAVLAAEPHDLRPAAPPRRVDASQVEAADVQRGQTTAILAALGRIELSLDLLERRVSRLEGASGPKHAAVPDPDGEAHAAVDEAVDGARAGPEA